MDPKKSKAKIYSVPQTLHPDGLLLQEPFQHRSHQTMNGMSGSLNFPFDFLSQPVSMLWSSVDFYFFNFVLQCVLCDVNGAFCHGSKMWVLSVKRFGFWLNFGQYILCYPWACLSFYFDFRFHFLDAMHVMLNRECLVQGINIISMIRNREYVGCLFIIC